MPVSPELLALLRCPLTKAELAYDESAQTLTSKDLGLVYRIDDDIPIMLVEEATIPAGLGSLEDLIAKHDPPRTPSA